MWSDYLRQQQKIIFSSLSLKTYGFFLTLTHLWTFLYWRNYNFFLNAQGSQNSEALCFPFFPNCDLFRIFIADSLWLTLLYFYAAVTLITGFFFLSDGQKKWGYYGLLILTFYKLFLHLSNYNFMGNYHYMIYILSLIYLFSPEKKKIIALAIVSFYLAAGLLKINVDWLSGAAMITTPWLNGRLLIYSLFYVVFLELFLIFGLYSTQKWIRYFTILQLLLFHAFSWHIVGFFYPLMMFSALSFFILQEYEFVKKTDSFQSLFTPLKPIKEHLPLILFLFVFWGMQALPFALSPDPALSGSLRLSALNMFDAKAECHSLMVAHRKGSAVHLEPPLKNLGVRMGCDPLVFLNQAHQLCRKNRKSTEFERLSLHLFSKRVTQHQYQNILALDDVCKIKNPLWAELSGTKK